LVLKQKTLNFDFNSETIVFDPLPYFDPPIKAEKYLVGDRIVFLNTHYTEDNFYSCRGCCATADETPACSGYLGTVVEKPDIVNGHLRNPVCFIVLDHYPLECHKGCNDNPNPVATYEDLRLISPTEGRK
jgi:hypothetical protein